ncbi:glutamate-rich protein 6-like isoform X6 [Babylonia areolata]|uniref:glutamate-rich protein 6-like isoform X6 n=1 Tax=Babylonia areolata TaxID=304850 RepID=UPI003FD0AF43
MDAIRPMQSQNSLLSTDLKEPEKEGEGYASDTDSDYDQQNNCDAVSSSSRASSAGADHLKTRTTPAGKDSRKSTGRGGRSAHSVSFSRNSSRAVEKRTRYDGREVTMVSLNTQTDWDWLETAHSAGKVKTLIPTEELTSRHSSSSRGGLKSILVKPESRETTSRPRTELGASSAADSRAETDFTPFSLQPNDEYGIPLLEMSSTSDDSSDEEAPKKKRGPRVSLPSVGPPQILKYVRESDMPSEEVEQGAEEEEGGEVRTEEGDLPVDEEGKTLGMFTGPCEFCHNTILPLPTVDMQQSQDPASLYCCEDYREFIEFATSTAARMEQEAQKATKMISVKVHPHHGSKQARRAAKERAVERMRQRELARRQQEALGSQANFYSSGASTGAPASGVPSRPTQVSLKPATLGGGGGGGGMFKDMARQMKTINYQLSSQRCLEEGWTLRPPSPLDAEDADTEVFVPEPLHPAMIASGNVRGRQLIEKYYPNGAKFITMFPDGTGNVLYPSGRVAILISSVSLGQYSYIVQDDSPEGHILANFDPSGFGCIYFLNGNVRLYYDQLGGMEADVFGAKRRRWQWKDQETHVHAPPFQPLCVRLNHQTSVRIMSQEAIALTFMSSRRSCRFSVGARLKLVAPELLPRKEIDEHQLYIDERTARVENILSKVSVLLKFPKSPKVDKILPPLHVTSKMHRNEKMRKELSASLRGSADGKAPKGKNNAFPVVSVN